MRKILDHLGKETGLVAYSSDVSRAAQIGAVDHALILDKELHHSVERRKEIDSLINSIRMTGGKVTIMSSMHESGKILEGFGKLAAILRFKMPK